MERRNKQNAKNKNVQQNLTANCSSDRVNLADILLYVRFAYGLFFSKNYLNPLTPNRRV